MTAPRVAVLHQGCIPIYRRALYEQLQSVSEREYVIFHGDPEPGSGIIAAKSPFPFPNVFVLNRFLRVFGRTIVWQPVILQILKGRFDALVIGHEAKYVANIILLLIFRLLRRPVLLWGFGQVREYPNGQTLCGEWLARVVKFTQRFMVWAATDFMAYTELGAERVAQMGMPRDRVSILRNTLDMSEAVAAHARAQAFDIVDLRRSFGVEVNSVVLTFVGRLTKAKRVDVLVDAARSLAAGGFGIDVLIVGAGPEEARLKQIAGHERWCHFLGPIYHPDEISRVFRISNAVVIPGYVGLAVNHAFAHGVPVITCQSSMHSPEIEYVMHEHNGLLLSSDRDLGDGLRRFIGSAELRKRLAEGALQSRQELDLPRMVRAFDSAVAAALARSNLVGK